MNFTVTKNRRGWAVSRDGSLLWIFPDKGEAVQYASNEASVVRGTLVIFQENGETKTHNYSVVS
jgi:hypothetical protein